MNKMVFCAAAAVAVAAITAGCRSGSPCCDKKGCTKMTNEEFYDGGTFDDFRSAYSGRLEERA